MDKNYQEKYEKSWYIFFIIIGLVFVATIVFHIYSIDKSIEAYEKQQQEAWSQTPILKEEYNRTGRSSDEVIDTDDYFFNSFEDAQVAYLNAYLASNYERSFLIANNTMNQYKDGELELNYKQELLTQFQIYDSNLQILTLSEYDYLYDDIGMKYEVIDFIMTQILSYRDDIESFKLIKENNYLRKIFEFAEKYEKRKLK